MLRWQGILVLSFLLKGIMGRNNKESVFYSGYRVLYSMPNGAKIFWQRCHQSMVTAVNSCPWFVAEGTLVLIMSSCKIQMALSVSTGQSDAVARCLPYLFVSWDGNFSHAVYHRVSNFRFRGKLKECRIKTSQIRESSLLFRGLKCLLALVLLK